MNVIIWKEYRGVVLQGEGAEIKKVKCTPVLSLHSVNTVGQFSKICHEIH